jgi:hypothetical protein
MREPALLKFNGPTEHALENLRNLALYCQHFTAFNDPFEFWTRFVDGIPDPAMERNRFVAAVKAWGFSEDQLEEAMQNSKDYFESLDGTQPPFTAMTESMRIACFGSECDSLLMWSHYADGLRGFCIVFDEDLVVNVEPKGYVTNVAYLDAPPTVDCFVYAIAQDQHDYHQMAIGETETEIKYLGKTVPIGLVQGYQEAAAAALKHMREMWQHAFAAKPVEWHYEKERRLLLDSNVNDRRPLLRSYPKEAVREIIIGERMPPTYLEKLMEIVKEQFGEIPVRTARRSSIQYRLNIE